MSIFEYNDERQARLFRREGYEDGTEHGRLQMMAEMVARVMNAKGVGFQEACSFILLNDEEITACKEFMDQMNSENER